MNARSLAMSTALALVAASGCAPPCTDDGLQQDCEDHDALVTVAVDEAGSDEEEGDDDQDSDDDAGATTDGADDSADGTSPGSSTGASESATMTMSGTESATAEEGSNEGTPLEDTSAGSTDEGPLDEGPLEESSSDDGNEPQADEYESCEPAECVAGTQCIDVTDLEEYDSFCSPECVTDDDCPTVPGGVESWCALVPDGRLDPQSCVLVCSVDDIPQGDCPGSMECVDVPNVGSQISVCMWS